MRLGDLNREYKREGIHYYIVIEQEVDNQLEIKMLSRNQPKDLLPIEVRTQDGKTYFYYDITNKKSLKKMTEKNALSYIEIKTLFESIFETIEMTKEYLLEADSLLFEEETIYKSEQYRFIYLPGRKNNIVKQIQSLVLYLMDKIDYQDQEAVVYIYGLYRIVREGNFNMDSLRDLEYKKEQNPYNQIMEEHRQRKDEMEDILSRRSIEKSEQEEIRYEKSGREKSEYEKLGQKNLGQKNLEHKNLRQKKIDSVYKKQINGQGIRGKIENSSIPLHWIPLVFLGLLLAYEGYYMYGRAASMEIQISCIITFFGFILYLISIFWWIKKKKEKKKVDRLFSSLERQSENMYSSETTVLDEAYVERKLAKLSPVLESEESPIIITKEKFIIGNMLGNADGKIDKKQISRAHALIEKNGDKFFIKDLKSTNGTSVNGIFLKEGECARIKDKDEIEFGDCAYFFRIFE